MYAEHMSDVLQKVKSSPNAYKMLTKHLKHIPYVSPSPAVCASYTSKYVNTCWTYVRYTLDLMINVSKATSPLTRTRGVCVTFAVSIRVHFWPNATPLLCTRMHLWCIFIALSAVYL